MAARASDVTFSLSENELRPGYKDDDIAVVGMSCKTAGASDLAEFWDLLQTGTSNHTVVPTERVDMRPPNKDPEPERSWYGHFVDDHDKFDHRFFRMSAREAASTDPQQRQMLQTAYQALESAGYFHAPETDVGCFVGLSAVDYAHNVAGNPPNAYSITGTLASFTASKVSHFFGWSGPAMVLDTACSSSAVAVHQACRAIAQGECSSALAGAALIMGSPSMFRNLDAASFLSRTGGCKPFGADGDGYCRAEGSVAVYLTRMSDAIARGRPILACLASTRVRQNANEVPIVVPHVPSLSLLFGDTVDRAGISRSEITVVESHGTGTEVGDLAEWTALDQALGKVDRAKPVMVRSVKGNIGHTENASGLVALVKTVMMIGQGIVPGQTNLERSRSFVNESLSLEVSTQSRSWDEDFRAVMVNNFGASGVLSAMVVTQPFRRRLARSVDQDFETTYPFVLCANSRSSLMSFAARLSKWIESLTNGLKSSYLSAADLSFNLTYQSNMSLEHRLVFTAKTVQEVKDHLNRITSDAVVSRNSTFTNGDQVILCFGGQGVDHIGLSRDVFDKSEIFREHLNFCDSSFKAIGLEGIYPYIFQTESVDDPVILQTSLFALQYASAKTWIDARAKVVAVVGHSFGELTALCVSGILSLDDATKVISKRAACIRDHWSTNKGAMVAVLGDLASVQEALRLVRTAAQYEAVVIACYNSPRSFTVSGSESAVERFDRAATELGLRTRRLKVTHAFHSPLAESIKEKLEESFGDITINSAKFPVEHSLEAGGGPISSVGQFVGKHLCDPVFFNHAVRRLSERYPNATWLEAGSQSSIMKMVAQSMDRPSAGGTFSTSICEDGSIDKLADLTAELWTRFSSLQYWPHQGKQNFRRLRLNIPAYQFDKQRHWVDLKSVEPESAEPKSVDAPSQRSLCTFLNYVGKGTARFQVDTKSPGYLKYLSGHKVASQVPVCPATAQISLVIYAAKLLDVNDQDHMPWASHVSYLAPLCEELRKPLRIDLTAAGSRSRHWSWKLFCEGSSTTEEQVFSTGQLQFALADDIEQLGLRKWRETVKHSDCEALLSNVEADHVMKGQVVYKAFSDVMEYSSEYHGVQRLAATGPYSAGRVLKTYGANEHPDPVIADCFAQVAGIWVNCLNDRPSSSLYIASALDQWIPANPARRDIIEKQAWDVYAIHRKDDGGGNQVCSSDVFVFDSVTGEIVEVLLGIRFTEVSRKAFQGALAHLKAREEMSDGTNSAQVAQGALSTTCGAPKPLVSWNNDAVDQVRTMLAQLCGMGVEEIQDTAILSDLGVDSLMSMELARELKAKFSKKISAREVATLTTFADLCQRVAGDMESTSDQKNFPRHHVDSYTRQWRRPKLAVVRQPNPPRTSVLVTGASGSLGSHVVAHLISMSNVDQVVCLNRKRIGDVWLRQMESFEEKGLKPNMLDLGKLKVLSSGMDSDRLGLTPTDYEMLVRNITHVCHVGWPMSASRELKSFQKQFNIMLNLLNLCTDIASGYDFKVTFQFISSFTAVGNKSGLVDEKLIEPSGVLPVGYAKAKHVCEMMLSETLGTDATTFRAMSVRPGIISGSRKTGYWKTDEHIPRMLRSSQALGVLPVLGGSVSWTPVDDVASVIADLLLTPDATYPVYHISNPSDQPWETITGWLADGLDMPREFVSFADWTRRVRDFAGRPDDNPAFLSIDFLEKHFEQLWGNNLHLGNSECLSASKSQSRMLPIDLETIKRYIGAWRKAGILRET